MGLGEMLFNKIHICFAVKFKIELNELNNLHSFQSISSYTLQLSHQLSVKSDHFFVNLHCYFVPCPFNMQKFLIFM